MAVHPHYTITVQSKTVRQEVDALAAFATLSNRFNPDYLLVGSRASAMYQQWLLPIRKMIELRIRPVDQAQWRMVFPPDWSVLSEIPTLSQMRAATRLVRLETTLDDALYRRRRVIEGLNVIAPEDLALELLARAATQISLAELAALLVKQRSVLDWDYLAKRAATFGLVARLREIMTAINREAGQPLLPVKKMTRRAAPKNARTSQPSPYLVAHLPSELHPTRFPPIAPTTITDLLRGLRASGKLASGK